ncbi:MAG: hypothetical protein GY717_17325 [Rhodobacteraceae bacterium]|nr:hypothetical protein [Paracoccaceae bacterium]
MGGGDAGRDAAAAHGKRNLRYYPWYGRGFVQLTWERDYHKAGTELGVDLTTDPAKVMQPEISAEILVIGSLEGWFTGKKLADYITLQRPNYRGARRIINGTDKAAAIVEIAREYEQALLAEGYGLEAMPPEIEDQHVGEADLHGPLRDNANALAEHIADLPDGTPIELWFQDEASMGKKAGASASGHAWG